MKTTDKYPSPRILAKALILPHTKFQSSQKLITTTIGKIIPKQKIITLDTNHPCINSDTKKSHLFDNKKYTFDEVSLALKYFFKKFQLIPIICKNSSLIRYRITSEQILETLKAIKEGALLIALTNLTMHNSEATVRKRDRMLINDIINLDSEHLFKKLRTKDFKISGEASIIILLECLKRLNIKKSRVVSYAVQTKNTGKHLSTSGYVGIIFQ